MAIDSWAERASRIEQRLQELAGVTDEPGVLTRTFLSSAMREANARVREWMLEAGLQTHEDYAGNLVGRQCSNGGSTERQLTDSGLPILLVGSHLDTVRNAGRYDGPLGVVLGIEVADWARNADRQFPFELAVVGFSDEEGVRFKTGFLGRSAFCGSLSSDDLKAIEPNGVVLGSLLSDR